MEEQRTSPIDCMAQLLAEMTKRALEAERQRDAYKEDAENWYNVYHVSQRENEELKERLEGKEEELKDLKDSIQDYIEQIKAEQIKRRTEENE